MSRNATLWTIHALKLPQQVISYCALKQYLYKLETQLTLIYLKGQQNHNDIHLFYYERYKNGV